MDTLYTTLILVILIELLAVLTYILFFFFLRKLRGEKPKKVSDENKINKAEEAEKVDFKKLQMRLAPKLFGQATPQIEFNEDFLVTNLLCSIDKTLKKTESLAIKNILVFIFLSIELILITPAYALGYLTNYLYLVLIIFSPAVPTYFAYIFLK